MPHFRKYRRTNVAEMRPVEAHEDAMGFDPDENISVSEVDRVNGSPQLGDYVARNSKNHADMWLVNAEYFKENFEEIT